MAIPQPPLFGDYMSFGTGTAAARDTAQSSDSLSQYYDASSTIATATAENLTSSASPEAWSRALAHAPSTTTAAAAAATAPTTMPGHATGTTIEVHPRLDDSPSACSASPEQRFSTRTPSTTSNKSSGSRASTSSKSSAPPTESTSSGKRASRSSRASAGGADASRRDKFLERNRIAASKCRQRKKEWVNGLEEAKNGLESRNSQLQMEYNGLLGEVSRMKNQIMAHASCHDPNIDKWIDNEARRFVQAPGSGSEFPGAAAAGAGVGYGAFPEGPAGAPPPFPMDYQFEEGK